MQFRKVCFISLLLGGAATKIFLADLVENSINISSFWHIQPCQKGSRWNSYTDPLKPKEVQYSVCFSPGCLLKTFQFDIAPINTVFADYTFQSRYCTAKEPYECTEFFDISANIGDKRYTDDNTFTSTEPWVRVPSPQDQKYTDSSKPEFFIATGTVAIKNTGKNYISFIFNSRHICGALKNFSVYYYKCPALTECLTTFDEHNAPSKTKSVETYDGKCVANAVKVYGSEPMLKCMWNGTYETTGRCQCALGFERNENMCRKCGNDAFKPRVGDEKCIKCTKNSFSTYDKTTCKCMNGFYEDKGECFAIKELATDIQSLEFSTSTVTIKISKGEINASAYLVVVSPKDHIFLAKPFDLIGYNENNRAVAYVTGAFEKHGDKFVVGDGRSFNNPLLSKQDRSIDSWQLFKNMPLKPGTKYSILVVSYVNKDVFYATPSFIIRTHEEQSFDSSKRTQANTTTIIGLVTGFIFISLIGLAMFIFRKRIQSAFHKSRPQEIARVHIYETVDEFVKTNHQALKQNSTENILYQSQNLTPTGKDVGNVEGTATNDKTLMDEKTNAKNYQELTTAYNSDGLYQEKTSLDEQTDAKNYQELTTAYNSDGLYQGIKR